MAERAPKQLAEPKFLEPFSTCDSCIETLDDLDWVASSTFHVGEWALGVRSSSAEVDAAMRAMLAAHLVAIDAPANFSALMADQSGADGHVRAFNFLYRSSDPLVRTRAPGRVLRALLHYLSDFAEPESSTLRLAATGFVVGDRAIVAPDGIRFEMANVQTRLDRAGLQVIDAPVLHLEPESGCVVVPEPALTVDTAALAEFERRHPPSGRELEPVRPGRYPIAMWAFRTDEEQRGAVGGAQAVAAAAQQVVNAETFGAQLVLDLMVAVVGRTPVSGMSWQDPAGLAQQLCAFADRAGGE